jgi:hypothetical protein
MKKLIIYSGLVLMLGLSACSNNSQPAPQAAPSQQAPPASPPPPPPQPAPPKTEAEKEKDGTDIRVDKNGVQVKTKEGDRVNDVKIGKDSSSVEIKRPRK